MQRYKKIGIQ